jgi:hypothetical protein
MWHLPFSGGPFGGRAVGQCDLFYRRHVGGIKIFAFKINKMKKAVQSGKHH